MSEAKPLLGSGSRVDKTETAETEGNARCVCQRIQPLIWHMGSADRPVRMERGRESPQRA